MKIRKAAWKISSVALALIFIFAGGVSAKTGCTGVCSCHAGSSTKHHVHQVHREISNGKDVHLFNEPQPISGQIRSTQDVKLMLEKICSYYDQHEPSSPVPLLLRRAQRLVAKTFMDIVKDIAPEAIGQIKNISGLDNDTEQG